MGVDVEGVPRGRFVAGGEVGLGSDAGFAVVADEQRVFGAEGWSHGCAVQFPSGVVWLRDAMEWAGVQGMPLRACPIYL